MRRRVKAILPSKRDHSHRCCVCREFWKCRWFYKSECKVISNENGPYCPRCRRNEMKRRKREYLNDSQLAAKQRKQERSHVASKGGSCPGPALEKHAGRT